MEGSGKRKLSSYDQQSVDYVVSSKVDEDAFSFQWTLTNFSTLKVQDEIVSPVFQGGPKAQHSWQLVVEPCSRLDVDQVLLGSPRGPRKKAFSVRLRLVRFCPGYSGAKVKGLKARFLSTILGPKDSPLIQGSPSEFYSVNPKVPSDKQLLVSYQEPDNVLQAAPWAYFDQRMARYVFEDTVKLHCRVWILHQVEHSSSSYGLETETPKDAKLRRFQRLSKDLRKGFEASSCTDVSLLTETKIFRAHKFILTSRSPVFRTMFESQMVEARENLVKIRDFDEGSVANMLKYMYTGEAPIDSQNAMTVFQIADKYELLGLKKDCLDVMGNDLKAETAVATLELAILHDAMQLKEKVFSFVHRNKEKIIHTDEFNSFAQQNPEVILDLYKSQTTL